jgi:hypothetical protein
MAEPLPQGSAGSNLLQPRVHGERLFSDSPRPESLDENAATVLTHHRLIGPLDLDHWLRLEKIIEFVGDGL